MIKFLNYFLTFFVLLFVSATVVQAACAPPECGANDANGDPINDCTSSQQCLAKCCTAPPTGDGGTGGGGGGTPPNPPECTWTNVNCPSGTVANTSSILSSACVSFRSCRLGTAQGSGACCATHNVPNDTGGTDTICDKYLLYLYSCVSICNTTAPTSFGYNQSTQLMTWVAGTGGTSQQLYVGTSQAQVQSNCTLAPSSSNPACAINISNLAASTASYSAVGLLQTGTTYYSKLVNL